MFLTRGELGGNLAGYGFFLLLLLVLASFFFCGPRSLGLLVLRLTLAAPLGLLAIFQAVLIPFFAIVGGAMAILNVQEYLARRRPWSPDGRRTTIAGPTPLVWASGFCCSACSFSPGRAG